MQLLDRMENLAIELNMPSVQPNQRSYSIALGIIATSAVRVDTSLAGYYKLNSNNNNDSAHEKYRNDNDNEKVMSIKKTSSNKPVKPLYAGMAAENILSRMLSNNFRPDAYTFASVLNTYQRIPDGKLEAALAADAVVRGMESLHLHGRIDDPPDVFHYTMLCACWSRSGGGGGGSEHHHGQDDVSTVVINPGERCSEILRHMNDRHADGYPRVKPNIRTYNAVIDSFAYSGKLEEAESMLFSMIDNFESSASRSTNGIEDTELPVRPDSFSFNTVIQQWARGRSADGGRRAELVLDRMLDFHYNGNADVRPDERSFAYIIYHYTKGAGRAVVNAPDRALRLLRKMVRMYRQGYKELLPSHQNKTNAMFAFTSVMDSHSILRRPDSGTIADELFNDMILLGRNIDALRPNTYACLSVLYAWSSCGSVDAGERATELLLRMEQDMNESISSRGEESRMKTTQRCYILAQTAWARCPSERKSVGAYEVLEMMENCYARGNKDAKPSVQAYSMVLNACAFADTYQDEMTGNVVKATLDNQLSAFHVAKMTFDRICKEPYINVRPTPVIYGTFIKCCGRLDLPESLVIDSAKHAFHICCNAGFVSDFVLTQLRCALSPEMFLSTLVMNGYSNIDKRGKSISRDGKRLRHIGINDLPKEWTRNVETNINNNKNYR
jgi:pentatricopeptide repeat protein